MKKTTITIATLAFVASTLAAPAAIAQERGRRPNDEKKDNTGAIIAGIAALGIGVAIATSKHGDKHRHDSEWDGNLYGYAWIRPSDAGCATSVWNQCAPTDPSEHTWDCCPAEVKRR